MPTFQDRAPRLNLSFPLQFRMGGSVISGHCLNLSESGLLGLFSEPLDLWTDGEVLLTYGGSTCQVRARVARSLESEAGLSFSFRTDAEREAVRAILKQAAATPHLVGRPPF